MDKTYSESVGLRAFDWKKELQLQIKGKGKVSQLELESKAGEWPTCACGNQCAIIPRSSLGAPFDTLLCDYGIYFCGHIQQRRWNEALATLQDIETRASVLIAEELTKLFASS